MSQLNLSVLTWVKDSVGKKLLAYLLGCDSQALPLLISGEVELTEKQREVVEDLSAFRKNISAELDDVSARNLLPNYLKYVTDDEQFVARVMHEHAVGAGDVVTCRDAMEQALAQLAIDTYPAFLLPPDPALPPVARYFISPIGQLLFRHPQQRAFVEAVQQDSTFKNIIPHIAGDGDESAAHERVWSTAERHLLTVSDLLLTSAWRRLGEEEFTPENFVTAALDGLRLLRDAYAGKACTVPAKVAFTGILLPPGRRLELDEGTVRAVTEAERRLVPETIKGQLTTGRDASGRSTLINYDGDVVLEFNVPYIVRAREDEAGSPRSMEMPSPSILKQTITRLRFSLVLATGQGRRVLLVDTWHGYDDPLHYGFVIQWRDRRHSGTILIPTQLTEAELQAWREWYDRLNTPGVANIELALNRILLAIAERTEPSDVLIDSVIAWQNILGGKNVEKCLARLLEKEDKAIQERKARLGKIYGLRSKVVHGETTIKGSDHSLCDEALDAAIQAVRILVSDRTDILDLKSGNERGKVLLSRT